MGEEKGLIEGATYPPLTLVSNYWLSGVGGGGINVPGGEKQRENIEKGIDPLFLVSDKNNCRSVRNYQGCLSHGLYENRVGRFLAF